MKRDPNFKFGPYSYQSQVDGHWINRTPYSPREFALWEVPDHTFDSSLFWKIPVGFIFICLVLAAI